MVLLPASPFWSITQRAPVGANNDEKGDDQYNDKTMMIILISTSPQSAITSSLPLHLELVEVEVDVEVEVERPVHLPMAPLLHKRSETFQ